MGSANRDLDLLFQVAHGQDHLHQMLQELDLFGLAEQIHGVATVCHGLENHLQDLDWAIAAGARRVPSGAVGWELLLTSAGSSLLGLLFRPALLFQAHNTGHE